MGGRFAETFLNGPVLARYLPGILDGVLVTVELAACVVIAGLVAGWALAVARSFAREAGVRPAEWLIVVFADVFRALPPLAVLLLFYFGAPALGIAPSGFLCTWAALSLSLAAFAEEIAWAGLNAVGRGQWEAARSTGLGFGHALIFVAAPQAARMTIPPLVNRTIAITKNTALGSVVAVPEILAQATAGVSFSGNPSPLTLGALAYVLLFLPVVVLGRSIERRFPRGASP